MASVLKGVNKAWNSNANMKAGTKVIQIVSRLALMKCPLLPVNIQKETDRETEKSML